MCKQAFFVCLLFAAAAAVGLADVDKTIQSRRSAAQQLFDSGNFQEAYDAFRALALDADNEPHNVGRDSDRAVQSLQRLGRLNEIDGFLEQVVSIHADNWRLLQTAARTYMGIIHDGYIVAGEFHRGYQRGGGEYANAFLRDRARALQLMHQARPLAENGTDAGELCSFYLQFAQHVLQGRSGHGAWQLQYLTDLSQLPDVEQAAHRHYGVWAEPSQGAPVDADGNPVLHHLPDSFESAATDGERWRWLLAQAEQAAPYRRNEIRTNIADFLRDQFGVRTIRQEYRPAPLRVDDDEHSPQESGPYALHTLGEDETIARLATGIKRFTLPDEFNFVRIYQQIASDPDNRHLAQTAVERLASVFEDRRQYPRAAGYWRESIERFGSTREKQQRLDQIVGNWGSFENVSVQPAGTGATVEFRYRNGTQVRFEAHRINVEKLIDDVKAYLKSNPDRLDWQQMNVGNIGYRLVVQDQKQYLGDRVAEWTAELDPRTGHFDRRMTVTTPLETAGAYLLTAKMSGGNTSRIVVWLSNTVIVRKQLDNSVLYFVADAVTGRPIAKANLEFFGYQQKSVGRNRYQVLTSNFAELTDDNGQVLADPKLLDDEYQWIAIVRTEDGRLAHLGFNSIWYGRRRDASYQQTKALAITDRPVYRPEQPVKFKFWVGNARYDTPHVAEFSGRAFQVRIFNPQGESVFEQKYRADAYGGFDGEFELPVDAALGVYQIRIVDGGISGSGTFRVEEYKKPEYEVLVEAPSAPVALGEKIAATVRARYYFGAPVTSARVHYKVLRTSYSQEWYPPALWDWFYGPGYWWFAYDYEWYPGWDIWGCRRPYPFWWPRREGPPEVVLDNQVDIGPDGTVSIEIDTELAKQWHGDSDHRYTITAEVVDQSRRTVVGTGQVLVARRPFRVFNWTDRGYYRTGDVIQARFQAHTLDRKPVQGRGTLTLYRVTYDGASQPVETVAQTWELDTDERGAAEQKITASQAGQYRLAYELTDNAGHTEEGAYVFIVAGDDFDGTQFRFNDIELITDRKEYRPGDKVKLLINTNRVGSTVLLFLRPSNGVYPRPVMLKLPGKSTVYELDVAPADMPNFFLEACTVSNGKLHSETREVYVPPEKRIANVEVVPSSDEYKPGQPATVELKLTDLEGKPFVGSTVITVYDKSVEYISGGPNVPEIREYFWKWRRTHYPQSHTNLDRMFGNLLRPGETSMAAVGAFGDLIFDSDPSADDATFGRDRAEAPMMLGTELRSLSGRMSQMGDVQEGAADAFREKAAGESEQDFVQPTVRTEFADTAFWAAAVTADENGMAHVEFDMPENLTTWKIRVWTMGDGTRVGQGEAEVVTSKKLLVRLQAPRFFVENDEVVLSANVHNYLDAPKQVRVRLELDGDTLQLSDPSPRVVTVESGGEARIDWRVSVAHPGEAVVRVLALSDEESDALEMHFPARVHGMYKTDSFTGSIPADGSTAGVTMSVPSQRRQSETRLELRFSPTLAGALVDALPYLVHYPHKTTDTTLHRFLPTVITQNVLKRMDLDLTAIRDKRTNLNAQELGDDRERAADWKRYSHNPVFDDAEVARMVKQGVKALTEMQLSDGGWGWFSGWGEQSDAHTTALVVHGLQIAEQNGVALVPGMLANGVEWMKRRQDEKIERLENFEKGRRKRPTKAHADNLDALVYMVLVDAGHVDDRMHAYLYRDRTHLSVYALAMVGLAFEREGAADELRMIMRNIEQFLVEDDENQTAWLRMPENSYWWYWYGSETEANAFYLKLLARTDPRGTRAPRLVKYLLNNRKHATYWSCTRDTALAIEAMAEYLEATGEHKPEMTVEIFFDGKKQKEVEINAENLFSFDNSFIVVGDAVESGPHRLELRKTGTGAVYFNAYLTYFTLEDFITRSGLEVKVTRNYYRLHRADESIKVPGAEGQALDQRTEKYRRELLPNLASISSGDLVEVELEIESKNDYEYIVFEDHKAAGFEPVEVQSGYSANGLGAYLELRDERATFFVRRLPRGRHSVSYRLRAETPGRFSALPAAGYGMYAPELKGNSDEIRLAIED